LNHASSPKRNAVRKRHTQKAGKIRSTRCHRYRPTVLWSAARRDQVAADSEEAVDGQRPELGERVALEPAEPHRVIDNDRGGQDQRMKFRLLCLGENVAPIVRYLTPVPGWGAPAEWRTSVFGSGPPGWSELLMTSVPGAMGPADGVDRSGAPMGERGHGSW